MRTLRVGQKRCDLGTYIYHFQLHCPLLLLTIHIKGRERVRPEVHLVLQEIMFVLITNKHKTQFYPMRVITGIYL